MKKWAVQILRRQSAFDPVWTPSRVLEIEARTERSARRKAEKLESPYCMIGRIDEVKNQEVEK